MEPIKLLLINNVPMIVVRSGFTVIKYIPHFVHYEISETVELHM